MPPHAPGATTCLYDTATVPMVGETFTHPPTVRGFDYTAVPDVQTVWFRNHYYFKNAAGDWTETSPSPDYWKSTQWYWTEVTEVDSRAFWTMQNNTGLDYIGAEEQLPARWNLGFNIGVAQEIRWMRLDGSTVHATNNQFGQFGPHHWNVAINVQYVESCSF